MPRPPLLDDPRYHAFLASAHPHLSIDTETLGVPSFIAPLDTKEPLKPGLLRTLAGAVGSALPAQVAPMSLFIGTPFERYEQTHLLDEVRDPDTLAQHAIEYAKRNRLELAVVTNVDPKHSRLPQWIGAGFKALPSFPDTLIDLAPNNFDAHLARLPAEDRSGIRRNIKRFERAGHRLERMTSSKDEAAALYESYLPYFRRATVQWLPHTPAYFAGLAGLDEQVRLTIARTDRGEMAGFIVNFQDQNGFQSGRIGVHRDYHRSDAVYFRLLYHVIEESLLHGSGQLSFEPTGYRMKRHLGASSRPMVNLVLGVSPLWRTLLGSMTGVGRWLLGHLEQPDVLERIY